MMQLPRGVGSGGNLVDETQLPILRLQDLCTTSGQIMSRQGGGNSNTLPGTNIAPEKRWLEDYFPFGIPYFQGLC